MTRASDSYADRTPTRTANARGLVMGLSVLLAGLGACAAHDNVEKDGVIATDDVPDGGPLDPDTSDVVEFEVQLDADGPEVVEPPKPGELGYPCTDNLACNSGFCIQTSDGRQCTRACIDECPENWECRQSPGQDAIYICLPRFINLCDPCKASADCNGPGQSGNYCLPGGDNGSFCGAGCDSNEDCPNDFTCNDQTLVGGLAVKQCMPTGGAACTCSPYAKQRLAATNCAVTNDDGSCDGTRFCLQQGLSLCDAATPFPESCDGLDNNCDERVDEFAPDYVCNITNDIGTCPGRGTCVEGVETCEGREARLDNNCDGIDDDCDGETDEDACNDGNVCTRDVCSQDADGATTCTYVADNDAICDDGNLCTAVDRCQNRVCAGSSPIVCDDNNPCTIDACDPVTGQCAFAPSPANTACNTNLCTVGEFCDGAGDCVGGTPKIYVKKSLGGCIEDGGTFHEDCQSFQCVGQGVCVPNHHERRDFDCRVGAGTCSPGRCGTDGKCGSTVPSNTACSAPTNGSPNQQCKTPTCVGFECRNVDVAVGAQIPCVVKDTCPPCARTFGFCICDGDGPGVCGSGGTCVESWSPNVDYCSSSACVGCGGICPNVCGFYVCFQ